ncbi:MAG: methyltransferase domain-containing protein [Porphyromonas sp.]|nr:methyltransferase domain-containing protein [Porphyromonas sp.]
MKQFALEHQASAHKVGTDGVLLGAYAAEYFAKEPPRAVLDVGTGSGLIALMLAQAFTDCHVTGIDIDAPSAQEASLNAARSPFASRISILEGDFTQLPTPKSPYDLIISNPPYFTESHFAEDARKTQAKHIGALTPDDIFEHSVSLLAPTTGRVMLILPPSTWDGFAKAASQYGYSVEHKLEVSTRAETPPKRLITLWSRDKVTSPTLSRLTLLAGSGRHDYTPEYQSLLASYLL